MNILLISPLPPPEGGIATWTIKYISFCEKNHINVSLVNTALTGLRKNKINNKRNYKDEILRTISIAKRLIDVLIYNNFDVVHFNSSCSNFGIFRDYLLIIIIYFFNKKIIFECHCSLDNALSSNIKKRLFKYIIKKCRTVLVLNKASSLIVKRISDGIDVRITPNFIDESYLFYDKVVSENISNVVFVGHVQPQKGCIEIINIAKKYPKIDFYLIGPISDTINSINKTQNVILLGAKDSSFIKETLRNSDIFLFPSHTEGFSLSMLEAMASGLPIIATDVGANEDMIESKGGIIVPVGNMEKIENALETLLGADVRKKASDFNVNKVRNSYLDNVVLSKIVKIYEELMNE